MIRTLLLGLAVGIAAANGASAEGKDASAIYGVGTLSCGQWQQYRASSTNRDLASRLLLQAWIDGFLSGYNLAAEGPDFLTSMPQDGRASFYIWIDNYCRDKPLDLLVKAATALKDELLARAR